MSFRADVQREVRKRARRAVVSAKRVGRPRMGDKWILELECGHKTQRPVLRKVYDPYPTLPAPRECYCIECPLRITSRRR